MHFDRRQFREQDFAVRPALRIAGALLLGFFVFLIAGQVPQTLQLKAVSPKSCTSGKGQVLCELGNWINTVTPSSLQGPLAAVGQIAMCVVLVFGVGWLLAPLVRAARRKLGFVSPTRFSP
jgi:hypothetical protein